MSVDIARLGLEVRSDGVVVANRRLRDLEKQAGRTERSTRSLARQAERAGRQMQKFGRDLSLRVTAPLVAVAAASVKLGADFDSELTKINTLVGVSRQEIAGFRREILRLAPALGSQPQEMASALFAVTSAGLRGADAMKTLEAASKASAIGLGDTRSVALAATAAVTAYGRKNLDASQAVEILVGTIEQGNVSAEAVAPVLGRVIGIAAELGVAFDDVGAFIATFTRLGVDAAEATTSLRGTLSAIQRPTEETRDTFAALGMSVEGFRQQIRDQGFITSFQVLVNRSREMNVDIAALIPNVRALSGVLGVFGGESDAAGDILKGVSGAVGTLDDRFQALIDLDPAFAFKQMRAELSSLAIEISVNLLPTFLELVAAVRDAAKWFRDLDAETQSLTIKIAAIAAVAGPVLMVLGAITKTVIALAPALLTVARALGPIGILVSVLGSLALTTKGIPAIMRSMKDETEGLGDESARTAGDVARLSGNLEQLQRIQIKEKFLEIQSQASDLRQEIIAMDAEIAAMTQGEFINPAFIEMEPVREGMLDRLQVMIGQLNTLQTAYDEAGEAGKDMGESTGDAGDEAEDAAIKFAELMERQRDFMGGIEEIEAKLSGPSAVALLEYRRSVERANELYGEGAITLKQYTRALDAFGAKLKSVTSQGDQFTGFIDFDFIMSSLDDVKWRMEEIAAIEWDFENLIDSFHPLSAEMRRLGDEIAKIDIALNEGVISQAEAGLARIGATANAAFNAMKSGVDSTSKEYEQLERAQQAINIAMGIAAILQQGMGDPYTAIARMLAVAAMVASLGVDAGNLSGGGSNSAEHRQRTQGTGSVLGDMDAQSESITNAVEITASATSELVGINRGMLRALQSLQSGIVGASGLLARGAGDADFEGVNVPDTGPMPQIFADIGNFLDPIGLFHGIFNAIHKWFGGKAKVIDEGIAILGGTIGELVDGALIAAFQTIKSRQWRFGSSSTDTEFQDLPDDIAAQFSLIFSAITDTVGEAALALGIPLDQIEARMATFRVQAQQISLMDLNAEEQQEALLAVFSQIFDDLAGHVVPFVRDFQEVGEGLGETLVRVANSVQVAQEAFFRLGLSIGEVDPRTMADISVSLVDAIGGLEEFITQMKSFVAAFAPAAHQFNIAQSDIARAMEQVGLAVPDTRDGMWELMQSLDASTEQGREQIATLLRLTETSRRYYDLLDDRNEIQRALLFRLGLGLTGEGFDPVSPVAPPVTITPPDPTPDPTPAPTDPSPPPVGPPDQPGPVLPEPPMDRIQSMQAFVAVLEGTADAADVSSLALQHHLAIIEELGRAGESMVDTFERLHRTVGILDEVMSVGNFTINKSREELIRFGDKLSEIFGDDLAHLGQNFERIMETFFTEDENVSAQADAFRARAASLLADLGIEATDELLTRSGFRDLFDDLFVMFTEAGDAASLAILSEAGAAIADLIDAEAELARIRGESVEAIRDQAAIDDILARMNREIQELGMSQFQIDMRDVGLQAEALRESLLAVGATQEELGIVNEWAEAQTRALIEAERERIDLLTQELLTGLQNTIADLVSSPLRTQLRRIQQAFQDAMRDAFETAEAEQALSLARERQRLQIAALETQLIASIERAQSRLFGDQEMVKPVRRAANNMRDAIIRGLEGVKDWLDRSLLDDLSTLMPEDRLTEARRQFTAAIDRVRAGDMTALADLPRLADQFRAEGSSFFGQTTSDFREIETFVRNAMQSVADQTIVPPEPPTAAQTQEIADNTERLAIEQAQMARQLADELGLLARLQGVAPSEIADRFDIPMGELLELIGVDLPSDVGGELEPMFNDLIREMDAELDAMHQVVRHLDGIIDLGMQHLEVAQHVSDTLERIAGGGIQGTEGFADKKRELDPVAREAIKTIGDRMDRIEGLLRQGNGQRDDHIRMTREGANEVVGANRETTRAVEDLSLPGRNRKATRV